MLMMAILLSLCKLCSNVVPLLVLVSLTPLNTAFRYLALSAESSLV
jgi:hypothetical protein